MTATGWERRPDRIVGPPSAHSQEAPALNVFVENGLAGCGLAPERGAVAVVVDALRASAMLASLFHYGTESALVVRDVEEAFAERERRPGAILVGERGGPMVPGFDLGNSPLQAPPEMDIREVIFSSSNCSRCCVGVGAAPAAFVGTTVIATATAAQLLETCGRLGVEDVVFVTAGAVDDEVRLTVEDHLAAGAVIAALERAGADAVLANDRARVCRALFGAGDQSALTGGFQGSDNGMRLTRLGLGADVEFASRLDAFTVVPRVTGLVALASGGQGALLRAASPSGE